MTHVESNTFKVISITSLVGEFYSILAQLHVSRGKQQNGSKVSAKTIKEPPPGYLIRPFPGHALRN